jgi:hypothetical protein
LFLLQIIVSLIGKKYFCWGNLFLDKKIGLSIIQTRFAFYDRSELAGEDGKKKAIGVLFAEQKDDSNRAEEETDLKGSYGGVR